MTDERVDELFKRFAGQAARLGAFKHVSLEQIGLVDELKDLAAVIAERTRGGQESRAWEGVSRMLGVLHVISGDLHRAEWALTASVTGSNSPRNR